MNRVGDLEVAQDLKHQQLEWRLERIIWSFLALVIVAALFGFFGAGPFSNTTIDADRLHIDYEQVGRRQAPEIMRLHLRPVGADTVVRLRFSRDFIDNIELEEISPTPDRVEAEAEHIGYLFHRGVGRSDSLTVTFAYLPRMAGLLHIDVQTGDASPLRFTEFVYP